MVLHNIACRICGSKCDEHSGRVCRECGEAIKGERKKLFKTEVEKYRSEVENM